MKRLEGKIAIVTGGSRGIGRAIVRSLALEGATVVIAARNPEDLVRALAESRGEGLHVEGVATDIAVEKSVDRLVEQVVKDHGRIDILVNNAGMGTFKPVAELSVAEFDTMWGTNMRGVFLATKAVLPHMMRLKG